jgi:hypothetical protein
MLLSMSVSNNVTWKQYMFLSELMFTTSYQCESCRSVLLFYETSVLNMGREHSVLIVAALACIGDDINVLQGSTISS